MKILLLTLVSLLVCNAHAQLIQWEPEITVADGSIYGNLRPRATIVGSNTPVVIFGQPSTFENLYVARWNGSSFDTPVSILPTGTSSYFADWTGPDIDAFGSTVIATFKMDPAEDGRVYVVRSTDGGLTFSDTIRVDNHPVGVAWMPSMAMDDNGNPTIAYMAHDLVWNNPRYVMVHSTDGGLTYTPEMEVSSMVPGEACDCCPSEVVINGNKEILLFRNNELNLRDMHAVYSADGGNTFTSYANVDNTGWSLSACPSTGADGAFYGNRLLTAFASAATGKYRVYISSATTDGPIGFESITQVPEPDQANGTQNFPRISVAGDTAVMAWRESTSGGQEIFCSVSLPGMDPLIGLSSFKQQSNASTAGIQTNPEIIYKNGFVHLFYSDNGSGNLIYRRGTIVATSGLEEMQTVAKIFPNPNTGQFTLPEGMENIRILDALGRPQSFTSGLSQAGIEIQLARTSPSGLYIVHGELDHVPITERLIVKH